MSDHVYRPTEAGEPREECGVCVFCGAWATSEGERPCLGSPTSSTISFWLSSMLVLVSLVAVGSVARADDFTDRIAQLEAQNAATAKKPADPFAKGNAARSETCNCGGPATCDCPKGTCKCPNCTFSKPTVAAKACPCSSACICGCNDGGECSCDSSPQVQRHSVPVRTYYAPQQPVFYAPPRQRFGGGSFCGTSG